LRKGAKLAVEERVREKKGTLNKKREKGPAGEKFINASFASLHLEWPISHEHSI